MCMNIPPHLNTLTDVTRFSEHMAIFFYRCRYLPFNKSPPSRAPIPNRYWASHCGG